MMTKKELISQLTSLVEDHTEGLRSANNKLFHSGQRLTAEKQEWEQKYHSAMIANKKLDEQHEELEQEKQALLDVISEWKSENHSLTALNEALSEELQELKKELANAEDARNIHYRAKLDQGKTIANLAAEVVELKKENHSINALNVTLSEKLQKLEELRVNQYQDLLKQEKSSQNWQGNYYAMQRLKDSLAKERDALMVKLEEAYKVGNRWFEDFKDLTIHCEKLKGELIEEKKRHEEFKTKSHGILATLEENLRMKQETIEALEIWKKGTESVLDTLDARLKDAIAAGKVQEGTIELLVTQKQELSENLQALKQINSFQEHRIEVLARKVNKMRKKEQND